MKSRLSRGLPTGAVVAVVALVLLASVVRGREEVRLSAPPQPTTVRNAEPGARSEDLELDRLVRQRSDRPVQDMFASRVPAPAAPTAPLAPPAATPAAPVAPIAPSLPFTYLGRMHKADRTIVYLLRNQQMLLAEAGETLENEYRIEAISESAIRFVYLPLGTSQVLNVPQTQ